jgi:hypothetical protein
MRRSIPTERFPLPRLPDRERRTPNAAQPRQRAIVSWNFYDIIGRVLMNNFGSSMRIWLVLLLTVALPLGSRAVTVRSSCHMACARDAKACHSCCADKPSCHLTTSKALPIAPSTSSVPNSQTDLLLLALPLAVPSLTTLSDAKVGAELIHELGAPPRDRLAQDCILLL